MTRGRASNTAHLVAADLDDAREQWITAFGRDRADLGPAAAGQAAAHAAAGYTTPPPLSEVLAELRTAWTEQLTAHRHLERLEERLEHVQAQAAWEARCQQTLAPLETQREAARAALERADQKSTGCAAILTERTEQHAAALHQAWDAQLVHAEHAARTIAAGRAGSASTAAEFAPPNSTSTPGRRPGHRCSPAATSTRTGSQPGRSSSALTSNGSPTPSTSTPAASPPPTTPTRPPS